MDATRGIAQATLAHAIAVLNKQITSAPDAAAEAIAPSVTGIPQSGSDAESTLDHRLRSIVADARKIDELATAIVTH